MPNSQSDPPTDQESISQFVEEEYLLSSPDEYVFPNFSEEAFPSSISPTQEYAYSPLTNFTSPDTTGENEHISAGTRNRNDILINTDTVTTAEGRSKTKRTFTGRLKEVQQSSNSLKLLPSHTIGSEPPSAASNKRRKNEDEIGGKCDESSHTFVGRSVLIGRNRRAKCHSCKASVTLYDLPEIAQQPCKGIDIEKQLIGYTGSTQLPNKDSIEAHRFTASSDGKRIKCIKRHCGISIYWFEAPWRTAEQRQDIRKYRGEA